MDKLRHRVQRRHVRHFLFQKVLDGFHVMVGGALNGFDARRIFFAETGDNCIKESVCVGIKCRNFLDLCGRASFCNQRTSTSTRNFSKPNSLKIARSG